MTFASGTKLGFYEVAVKVLPEAFAHDPEGWRVLPALARGRERDSLHKSRSEQPIDDECRY
jgi:hypothetical protein